MTKLLQQVISEIQKLPPEQQDAIALRLMAELKDSEESAKRTAFHQALVKSGLVRQIKNPNFEGKAQQPLIQVQGEPVSQTIIGERR